MTLQRALLLDLDDTLYDYAPAERDARNAALGAISESLGISRALIDTGYNEARERVKHRLGERGSAHSRLLYILELIATLGRPDALPHANGWNRLFWSAFLGGAQLREGAREMLVAWRAQGHKVAIVTDLIASVQLEKLEHFGLFSLVDVLVVSEEVPSDKPAPEGFELAIARLGIPKERCIMVGDSDARDGGGARQLGIPYLRAQPTDKSAGLTIAEIARELGVAP